ncbi:MAG TPA: Trp biosynthesis-associated membrane protein [Mycobacteriales bacterium]|nr:Trp biosynthesis-associated membrane protein [Mycobacteriales bacterium]
MTSRRAPAVALLTCAVGGLLVLLSSGRQWAHTVLTNVAGQGRSELSVTGHYVAPALPALGIALLALAAAIIAARGWLRRAVGVVVVLIGAAAIGVALTARGDVAAALERREVGAQGLTVHASANGWWLVAVLGGVLAVAAGALTVFRAGNWSGLGAKYDAPSAAAPAKDEAAVAWEALDRGEDPTA